MAEQRSRGRPDDPFTVRPSEDRSTEIREPTGPALTYKGEGLSSGLVMRLWRSARKAMTNSRERILEQRAYRRREASSLIRLAPTWAKRNPEAADWVVDVRPERTSLEQDLIARVGVIEPEFVRERLGFTERDRTAAEECQAFLEEWRLRYVPTQAMFGKCVEDGQFGWSLLPSMLDHDGMPSFFETLDDRAYELLDDDKKKAYKPDDDSSRKKRYVRIDERGRKKVNPRYDKGDNKKSEEAHKQAIARYLLHERPVSVRLIPALDCAPIFRRGRGRDRWECVALIERTRYQVEELLEMGYCWPGLGDRLLVPRAYAADGTSSSISSDEWSKDGELYLYTAYLVCRDEDGHDRPIVAWTVGGTSTVYAPAAGGEPGDGEVGLLDLFEAFKVEEKGGKTCGLEGPLWGYGGGMHSEDDDPDYYWRPAMHHVLPLVRQLEGNQTSINAAITQVSFGGHVQRIDAALATSDVGAQAILEDDNSLRRFKPPRPGEVEPSTGPIEPFQQARVGPDAWAKIQADQLTLQNVTAVDQAPGAGQSGNAQVIQLQTGQQSKRQLRDGVAAVVTAMGEAVLRVLDAYYRKYDVGWPIQTTQERPVGDEVIEARDILQYDPNWIGGENRNFSLTCEYPEEENLARVDLERTLAMAGFGNFDRVMRALGQKDPQNEWKKVLRDKLRNSPAYMMRAEGKLAVQTGDAELKAIITDLQEQQKLGKAALPGAKNGVPTVVMNRGQQDTGGGGQSIATNIRAGVQGGQIGADRAAADASAAMTQVGTA